MSEVVGAKFSAKMLRLIDWSTTLLNFLGERRGSIFEGSVSALCEVIFLLSFCLRYRVSHSEWLFLNEFFFKGNKMRSPSPPKIRIFDLEVEETIKIT